MEIVRTTERPACENCGKPPPITKSGSLMIRRETTYGDVQWWHFTCALLNDMVTEESLVRLARGFKGATR